MDPSVDRYVKQLTFAGERFAVDIKATLVEILTDHGEAVEYEARQLIGKHLRILAHGVENPQ